MHVYRAGKNYEAPDIERLGRVDPIIWRNNARNLAVLNRDIRQHAVSAR
jgi:hypothetical protein